MKKLFVLFTFLLVTIISFAQSVGGSVTSNDTVCSGTNSGLLTLAGHTGSVVRWQSSTNSGASWTNIANTTINLVYSNLTATTWYRAEVVLAPSPPNVSAYSTPAIITVDPASAGGAIAGAATVCTGTNSGTLTLSGHTGSVVQWEKSTDGGSTYSSVVNTTTSQSYSNLTTTTVYRVVVQSGTCSSTNSGTSTITVSPLSVGGTVTGASSVCANSNSGTLLLGGYTGSVVRWQSSADGGVTWTNITNTTYTNNYSNISQTTDYRAVVQSGNCAADNSTSSTITVSPVSVGGTTASAATVCSGANNGTILLTGHTGNVIRWEKSTDGGSAWTTIANTTDNYTYNNLTVNTLFRAVVQSGGCSSANSSSVLIAVTPASVGGTISGGSSACSGNNSGSLLLSGYTGNIVRWQSSVDGGVTWTNITNTTAINNYSNITQTTDYRAVLQSGSCPTANSSIATVTIFPISVGGTVNSSATVCSGSNGGTLQLVNYTGSVISWEKSTDNGTTWAVIANATDTLSYSNLTVKTLYRANVQSGACAVKTSLVATITVNAASAGGSVTASDTVCSGTNSGTLQLSGYVGSIVRWQSSTDGGVTWTNITNTTAINNYTNLTATTNFRAVIQSGSCPTVNSTEAIITVFPISAGGTVNSNATVCSGSNNGTLILTGYTGNVTRWEKSTDNGLTWINIANTTDTLSYINLTIKTLYRALVASGACTAKYSSIATITVNAASAGGTVAGTDTVCSGSNSGNLTLSGYVGSIVRWQSSTDGGVTWTNINNTTALYNYVNITGTTNFRAVIQNGGCAAANSTQATITVFPVSVGGALAPAVFSACSGINSGTIVLSGQSGNVLRWELSTDGGVTWVPISNTTLSQNFQNLSVTTKYRAIVQNGGCAPAYSGVSTISVFPATVGGNTLGGDTVCTGSNSGSLTVSGFTGSILNWEFSIDGGVTWTAIANTTAIQNYTNISTTTMYRAVVQSGSCSTANSTSATIMVNLASVGGSVLSSTTVCSGTNSGTLTLSGNTGSVMRWESSVNNGTTWTSISNTTNSLTFTNLTVKTMYRTMVQSGVCSFTFSQPATVSIALPAVASYSVVINGATVLFTNTSTSTSGTSNWNFGDGTSSTITSPAHTYTANGSYLVQLVITDACGSDTTTQTVIVSGLGVNELVYNNPDVIIYPNPFALSAILVVTGASISNVPSAFILYDLYGREAKAWDLEPGTTSLKLERGDLPGGIYFYKFISPYATIATGKVIIQ